MTKATSFFAGTLKQRVQIQSKIETPDDHGEIDEDWSTDNTRWAEVIPLKGGETFESDQQDGTNRYKVTMRFYPDLDSTFRILHKTRILNIDSVLDIEEGECKTVCECVEDVTNPAS